MIASSRSQQLVGMQLALDAATVEIVLALDREHVRSILIKGAAIAARLYDHPAQRPYGDIDLLIDPSTLPAVERTLQKLGYRDPLADAREHERARHARTWRRTAGPAPVCIDLHTSLYWCSDNPTAAWAELAHDTKQIELAGVPVEVLNDPAQALVIATHAVQHRQHPKPLGDLDRALARIDPAAWREAAAIAARLDASAVLAAGLARNPYGAKLANELDLDTEATVEMRLLIAGAPPLSLGLMRLSQTRTPQQLIRLIVGELAHTPDWMRCTSPLARRGPAGLALAYLHRPISLAYRAPAALRAWKTVTTTPTTPPCRGQTARGRLRALTPANIHAAAWAWRASSLARRQLQHGGLRALSLPDPPPTARTGTRGANAILNHRPLSCLERAAVRQRWHAAQGTNRDLIIGITNNQQPAAHAWLQGDPQQPVANHTELLHWPAQRPPDE